MFRSFARLPTPPCTREVPSARIRVPGSKPRGGNPLTFREPGGVNPGPSGSLLFVGKSAFPSNPLAQYRFLAWARGGNPCGVPVTGKSFPAHRGQEEAFQVHRSRPVPDLVAPPLVPARNSGRCFSRARAYGLWSSLPTHGVTPLSSVRRAPGVPAPPVRPGSLPSCPRAGLEAQHPPGGGTRPNGRPSLRRGFATEVSATEVSARVPTRL